MKPLVSILIPHFDRAALLDETLASVFAQSHAAWEVIVVDDGSSPDQWDAIQHHAEDERVRILRRTTEPAGPSRCRNLALDESGGDYVLFLDSDDVIAPWCLETRLEVMERIPDLDFGVFPTMLFHTEPGDHQTLWNRLDGEIGDLERFLRATPPWQTTSALWRREAIERVGGFNENLRYGTDSDLHTRALALGLRYRKFPDLVPDLFVRRDESPRFNSTLSDELFQARRARIQEGFAFLGTRPDGDRLRDMWESQYFSELEYLIYRVPHNRVAVRRLLDDWWSGYRPSPWLRLLVGGYAWAGVLTRRRAYLLLRIARRLTLLLLPERLRPLRASDGFHSARLPDRAFRELRARLHRSSSSMDR